jgi:hypothetical protein
MINLGPMTDRFSESGQKVVRRAIEESKQLGHNHLSIEHIFAASIMSVLIDLRTKQSGKDLEVFSFYICNFRFVILH